MSTKVIILILFLITCILIAIATKSSTDDDDDDDNYNCGTSKYMIDWPRRGGNPVNINTVNGQPMPVVIHEPNNHSFTTSIGHTLKNAMKPISNVLSEAANTVGEAGAIVVHNAIATSSIFPKKK